MSDAPQPRVENSAATRAHPTAINVALNSQPVAMGSALVALQSARGGKCFTANGARVIEGAPVGHVSLWSGLRIERRTGKEDAVQATRPACLIEDEPPPALHVTLQRSERKQDAKGSKPLGRSMAGICIQGERGSPLPV